MRFALSGNRQSCPANYDLDKRKKGNRVVSELKRRNKMKKILAFCLALCMIVSCFTAVAHAEGTMEVELTSDRYGHIYSEIGQTFKINVKNTLATDFNGKIVYDVLSGGSSIYSQEKEVNIAAGGLYNDFPVIEFPKYGIFELKATVTDGTTVYGTDTIAFSFINGSKNGEGNKKMLVNTHIEESSRPAAETVNAVRDAGFGGLRSPVYWFQVETDNKNEYKMPAFTENIKDAAEMGMEPLVVLSGGNGPWGVTNTAEGNLNMAPDTDTERQAFANYCAYVATNLKGYVKHYEIWNEFTMPSNGGDQSAANYAKLLIAASKAIKAVDPDAKIVAMCTAGVDRSFISSVISSLRSAGESNCYDILSVHPYSYGTSYKDPESSYSSLALVKSLAGSKPIWFTERGWDTSTTVNASTTNGISDYKQAVYGVRDYLVMLDKGSCDRWFWYDFQDDGTDAAEREDNFGMIEAVGAPIPGFAKPSYIAFAAMNKLLGQATYKQKNTYGSDGVLYSFTDAEGENLFALSGSVGTNVTVITGAGKYELLDMYSNVVAVYETESHIRFTQTDEIMYVRKHYEPAGCTVTVSGDELVISGYTVENDQPVSVMVTSSVDGGFIYMGQTTGDDERAYSFTADRKGAQELTVKVNYGNLYNKDMEIGFVLKLMCNGERIFSLNGVESTDNVDLVVSVNDEITTDTDVFAAVYDNGKDFHSIKWLELKPGTAKGEYTLDIRLKNNNFDKITGYVWENLDPVIDDVDFVKE